MRAIARCFSVLTLACCGSALAQSPPATPVITEPTTDDMILNGADVHMETAPFSDPDPGHQHFCSDWEIRDVSDDQMVWQAACATGLEAIHAHFGDGVFVGSHVGRTELFPETAFLLRVRHRDDSGDPATEWSDWAERPFTTGPATEIFPLELDDILPSPTPSWTTPFAEPVILPPSGDPPRLVVESGNGSPLLEIVAVDGISNQVIDYGVLADHVPVRVRLSAGDLGSTLALPETDLVFTDDEGDEEIIYLPGLAVGPGDDAYLWVAASGATYFGDGSQVDPDFSELARGVPVPWTAPPGFKVEMVASGFQLPVNIAFVPDPGTAPEDPLYYVTELYGTIKVVTNDGSVSDYATGLLNYAPTGAFPGSGEQGLTGIVVDPVTGDVFASLLYDASGPHYPKVERFSSIDGGLTASSSLTILDMAGEPQGQSHQISNLTLGPDGLLYVHMGDGFDASTAQNLDSFRGKVLRLELDGTAPADNPFYLASDGITARDYVHAYGLRNPFGGAWRAADSIHYQVENGPSIDRFSQILPGVNYLWDGSNQSMTNLAIHNWSPAVAPTNIVFIEATLFGGSLFPPAMMGHAFIADSGSTWATGTASNGKAIREYVLDADGELIGGPMPFVSYIGTGKATVVALAAGPDGLYFSDFYKDLDYDTPIDVGANILRIQYVGGADFVADVTVGPPPLAVQFSDLSTVPQPTAWEWDFGDGATSTEQDPAHTYLAEGSYDVRLSVVGANGVVVAEKPNYIFVGDPPAGEPVFRYGFSDATALPVIEDDSPAGNDALAGPLAALSADIPTTGVPADAGNRSLDTGDPAASGGTPSGAATVNSLLLDNASIAAAGGFTMETWFQWTGSPTDSVNSIIDYAGTEKIVLDTQATAPFPNQLTFRISPSGDILIGTPVVDQWHYVAVVFDTQGATVGAGGEISGLVTVYFDGTSPTASAAVTKDTFGDSLDRSIGIGMHPLGFDLDFFDGRIFEPRVRLGPVSPAALLYSVGTPFERGDMNGDGSRSLADAVFALGALFIPGAEPLGCLDAADTNDDGAAGLGDVVFFLNALFTPGAPPIPAPGPDCGLDPTSDGLDCATPPSCP